MNLAAALGFKRPKAADEAHVPTLDELRCAEQLLLGEAVYALLTQIRVTPSEDVRKSVNRTFSELGLTAASFRDHLNDESVDGVILAAAGVVAADQSRRFGLRTIEAELADMRHKGSRAAGDIGSLQTFFETRTEERERRDADWDPGWERRGKVLDLSLATYERIKVAHDVLTDSCVTLDPRAAEQVRAMLSSAAEYGQSSEDLDKARANERYYGSGSLVKRGNQVGGIWAAATALYHSFTESAEEVAVRTVISFLVGSVGATFYLAAQAERTRERAVAAATHHREARSTLDRRASDLPLPKQPPRRR